MEMKSGTILAVDQQCSYGAPCSNLIPKDARCWINPYQQISLRNLNHTFKPKSSSNSVHRDMLQQYTIPGRICVYLSNYEDCFKS